MINFLIWRNRDKADALVSALTAHGYQETTNPRLADMALIDYERQGSLCQLEEMRRHGKPVFVYPHAARTAMIWDGLVEPWKHTACNFVFAEGHREIMQAYGYPFPVEVIGWTYSPVLPFQPSASSLDGKRLLFAPIHPNAQKGSFAETDRDANATVFRKLLDLLEVAPSLTVRVRYGRDIDENGLWQPSGLDNRLTWEIARYDLADSITSMQKADVVIGHNTFAWMAVAMGKPTVMFSEATTPHNVNVYVRSWQKYCHLTEYPLDLLTSADNINATAGLIGRACLGGEDVETWKRRMIGEPFDGARFVDLLEHYAKGSQPAPADEQPDWRCIKCGLRVDPFVKYCQPCLQFYGIPGRLNRFERGKYPLTDEERHSMFREDRRKR
jgi:hypothetical protein